MQNAVIGRILQMESYYDALRSADPRTVAESPELREMLRALSEYLQGGAWREDYERDERGELPTGLKRGVLSQDGLYNLLCEMGRNETQYGAEARQKYGDDAVDFSNGKIKGASEEELKRVQELSEQINENLRRACAQGDPAGEAAQKACALHQQWIRFYWKRYSPQAHLGLCAMYLQDERFYAYYEKIAPKCADLLYEAMKIYLKDQL